MILDILFGVVFLGTIVLLAYDRSSARRRSGKGEPTPSYVAGNVPGHVAMLMISGSYLLGLKDPVLVIVAIIACGLVVASIALHIRAIRRDSRRAI